MQASRISNTMLNRSHAAHAVHAFDVSVSFTFWGEARVVRRRYQKREVQEGCTKKGGQ